MLPPHDQLWVILTQRGGHPDKVPPVPTADTQPSMRSPSSCRRICARRMLMYGGVDQVKMLRKQRPTAIFMRNLLAACNDAEQELIAIDQSNDGFIGF
ncbi:hypothetical protein IC615_17815 [Serratia ureilytica]